MTLGQAGDYRVNRRPWHPPAFIAPDEGGMAEMDERLYTKAQATPVTCASASLGAPGALPGDSADG